MVVVSPAKLRQNGTPTSSASSTPSWLRPNTSSPNDVLNDRCYSAVVAGATGATGRALIKTLLNSERCVRVRALVRPGGVARAREKLKRAPDGTEIVARPMKLQNHPGGRERLELVEVDYEKLCAGDGAEAASALGGCTRAFNCLGTTKKDAGGMKGWRHVDKDYYAAFARACKAQGVTAYAQISWQGASTRSLLSQVRTKGETDAIAIGLGFPRLAILRAGLLERGDVTRGVERVGRLVTKALPVASLARAAMATLDTADEEITILEGRKLFKY